MSGCEMVCQFDHGISMRDGVVLRGNLFRPAGPTPCPVLVLRTVFRKDWMGRGYGQYDPSFWVRHGYAVYIQDVRGLGASEGEFDRFTSDGPDGYDTIEALAACEWCDGQVGMIGSYFAGYAQLMAAAEHPPHLKAICPMQTSVSINRDCDNRGFLFASHIGWCTSRLVSRLRDGRYPEQVTRKYLPRMLDVLHTYVDSQLRSIPIGDMPVLRDSPFLIHQDYRRHLLDGFDDFELLHKEGRDMDVGRIHTPALYICGWLDSSRTPLLDHCAAQLAKGISSKVLIIPWEPGEAPARVDSPLEDGEMIVDLQAEMLAWFDEHLKGKAATNSSAIRYFDIVTKSCEAMASWPPEHVTPRTFWLNEQGTLSDRAPEHTGKDAYLHEPLHPLPYFPVGPCAAPLDRNAKTLCYTSAAVDADYRILGDGKATVFLSCTAADTDVMMSLVDVSPDGRCFIICDGATRARYRMDWISRPLTPNEIYTVEVELGRICYTLRAGHRLRLVITGSAFPKYDVNHGTGQRPIQDAQTVTSTTNVYYGPSYPSRLCLTVKSMS